MSSLRTRLFIILVAATSLIWLFAIGWISVGTKHEVENVLDSRLEQAARMVSSLVTSNNVPSPSDDSDSAHIGGTQLRAAAGLSDLVARRPACRTDARRPEHELER